MSITTFLVLCALLYEKKFYLRQIPQKNYRYYFESYFGAPINYYCFNYNDLVTRNKLWRW